ncbi:hypothetical protein WJX82_010787 [Trebouxia sp. C0006]
MPVVWFIFESFDRLASGLLVSIADFIFENVISGDTEGRRAKGGLIDASRDKQVCSESISYAETAPMTYNSQQAECGVLWVN